MNTYNSTKNSYVKKQLTDTLIRLLKKKKINEITVDELCKTAGVGRVSFYRNYQSKENILSEYIQNVTEDWIRQNGSLHISIPASREYIISLLNHLYDFRGFIDILLKNNLTYLLEKEFDQRISEHLRISENPYSIAYTAGGFFKLFLYWADTGYQLSAEEIADHLEMI